MKRIRVKNTEGGNYFAAPKTSIEFISSGSKTLDLALGGGWAEGRIANVIGDRSSGKTLLMIEASANFIKKHPNGRIKYREAEAAFDIPYAQALNMPIESVDFGNGLFETIEDLFEDLTATLKEASTEPILYICDSLDALSDRAEMGRDMSEGSYGTEKAKKLSQLFRRLVRQMSSTKLTLLIVSQIRSKIGFTVGKTTTRSGGRALDFYASQVISLAQLGKISRTISGVKRVTGINVKASVDKNKVGLSYRDAEFKITFGYGIDDIEACLEWLKETKNLARYKWDEEPLSEAGSKKFLSSLNSLSDEEFNTARTKLHDVVETCWYEIEDKFLPKRKKYV